MLTKSNRSWSDFDSRFMLLLYGMFFSLTAQSMEAPYERAPEQCSLFQAIVKGNLKKLERIYPKKSRFSHDYQGRTKLYLAALYGHETLVQFLLDQGEDPNRANIYRFTTRLQGKRTSDFIEKPARPGAVNKLAGAGGFPVDIFSSGKLSTLKGRSLHGLTGSLDIEDRTPIFALVMKPEFSAHDLSIAKLLLESGAKLDSEDRWRKTPVQLLEERLFNLANKDPLSSPRSQQNNQLAKSLFTIAMKDESFLKTMTPYWYLLANSQTTTTLIDLHNNSRTKNAQRFSAFLDDIVTWRLDVLAPEPQSALESYGKITIHLSEEQRFFMLLTYFIKKPYVLTSLREHDKEDKKTLTLRDISNADTDDVAEAIYIVHRDLFLAIDPKQIAVKYCRKDSDPVLDNFLTRVDRLSNLVAYAIADSQKPQEQLNFWHEVATKLLKQNDLFGYWCLATGLKSPPVVRLLDETPTFLDFQRYKIYMAERNSRNVGALIPSVIGEGGHFAARLDKMSLFPDDMFRAHVDSMPEAIDTFIKDFTAMQNALRRESLERESRSAELKPLIYFFSTLPHMETKENAAEFRSLGCNRSKRSMSITGDFRTAEYWNTEDLYQWVHARRLSSHIPKLIQHFIVDGPSFVANYAIARSKRASELDSVRQVFDTYLEWSLRRNIEPLGNLPFDQQFPANPITHEASSFHWIMWLRNNGLANFIPILMDNRIDSFRAFIERRLSAGILENFYGEIGIVHKVTMAKLEHLVKLFVISHRHPPIEDWKLLNLESWFLESGFGHLIFAVMEDNAWQADRFLALFYFWKAYRPKLNTLRLNRAWTSVVFDELDKQHNIVSTLRAQSEANFKLITKKDKNSELFFIRVLVSLKAVDLLPNLYEKRVRTLYALAQILRDPIRGREKNLVLSEFGFSDEQVHKLVEMLGLN